MSGRSKSAPGEKVKDEGGRIKDEVKPSYFILHPSAFILPVHTGYRVTASPGTGGCIAAGFCCMAIRFAGLPIRAQACRPITTDSMSPPRALARRENKSVSAT